MDYWTGVFCMPTWFGIVAPGEILLETRRTAFKTTQKLCRPAYQPALHSKHSLSPSTPNWTLKAQNPGRRCHDFLRQQVLAKLIVSFSIRTFGIHDASIPTFGSLNLPKTMGGWHTGPRCGGRAVPGTLKGTGISASLSGCECCKQMFKQRLGNTGCGPAAPPRRNN